VFVKVRSNCFLPLISKLLVLSGLRMKMAVVRLNLLHTAVQTELQ
jgi:hypothetical protein